MNTQITIKGIPVDNLYEGYLWKSDAKDPVVFEQENLTKFPFDTLKTSFIIEGQLYCADTKKSYSIKFVDGEYCIIEYDLKAIPTDWVKTKESKEFVPNRMRGASKLKFDEYWKKEVDDLCLNMPVLKPAAFVFVGFKK